MDMYQHDSATMFQFVLRGELRGDSVQDLEHAWTTAKSVLEAKELVVDVFGITNANPSGVDLLSRMRGSGAQLTAALPRKSEEWGSCLTQVIALAQARWGGPPGPRRTPSSALLGGRPGGRPRARAPAPHGFTHVGYLSQADTPIRGIPPSLGYSGGSAKRLAPHTRAACAPKVCLSGFRNLRREAWQSARIQLPSVPLQAKTTRTSAFFEPGRLSTSKSILAAAGSQAAVAEACGQAAQRGAMALLDLQKPDWHPLRPKSPERLESRYCITPWRQKTIGRLWRASV